MSKKMVIHTRAELHRFLSPLLQRLQQVHDQNWLHQHSKTTIIGLQGGQGTGKTTLGHFLGEELRKRGYRVTAFSIDDFYKSAPERRKLQKQYPHNAFYLISRGMPGTHRVALLKRTLAQLKKGQDTQLPIFDKSLHQGFGGIARETISIKGRQDFVILEGWCIGLPVISSKEVIKICQKNKINLRKLDPFLRDHQVVLQQSKPYQPLWKYLNYVIMLKPDSSRLHRQWRIQQERGLRKKTERKGMTNKEIEHFVNVYLPFTYVCYEKVKPDVMLRINKRHQVYKARYL